MSALPISDPVDWPGRPWRHVPTNELIIELHLRDLEACESIEGIWAADGSPIPAGFTAEDLEAIRTTWRLNLERDREQSLRQMTDRELAAALESIRYLALEAGQGSDDRRIVQLKAQAINREVARRRKLREARPNDPMRPPAPVMDRDRSRIEKAHERYPIDRFCEEMLQMRLERRGSIFKGLCPFPDHQEKTPSFVVYPASGRARCFGCNRGGDILDLTQIYFGCSILEALDKIEDTY